MLCSITQPIAKPWFAENDSMWYWKFSVGIMTSSNWDIIIQGSKRWIHIWGELGVLLSSEQLLALVSEHVLECWKKGSLIRRKFNPRFLMIWNPCFMYRLCDIPTEGISWWVGPLIEFGVMCCTLSTSCVITKCGQQQLVIPSLFSIFLTSLAGGIH